MRCAYRALRPYAKRMDPRVKPAGDGQWVDAESN
jgi:hypothetical protein